MDDEPITLRTCARAQMFFNVLKSIERILRVRIVCHQVSRASCACLSRPHIRKHTYTHTHASHTLHVCIYDVCRGGFDSIFGLDAKATAAHCSHKTHTIVCQQRRRQPSILTHHKSAQIRSSHFNQTTYTHIANTHICTHVFTHACRETRRNKPRRNG